MTHYKQIGPDIEFDSESINDYFGSSVAVNKNGTSMAIAAMGEDGMRGAVRMFSLDTYSETWIQLGQVLRGKQQEHFFGLSIDMNADGTRVVVGGPGKNNSQGSTSVYEFSCTDQIWKRLGTEIIPNQTGGHAGLSVAINGVGDIILVGAPYNDNHRGLVQAYELVDENWKPMGQAIVAKYRSHLGSSVGLSADGKRFVLGNKQYLTNSGSVEIHEFDDSSKQWTLMKAIHGVNYYDRLGDSVDMSEDGNRIVFGVPNSDQGPKESVTVDSGQVYVYDYDGSDWNMVGEPITNPTSSDRLGRSVAISGDGSHIALAAPGSDGSNTALAAPGAGVDDVIQNTGKVDVYTYSEKQGRWIANINPIYGDCSNDQYGEVGALAMDRFGTHLVIGAGHGNYYRGIARAYVLTQGPRDKSNIPPVECLTS